MSHGTEMERQFEPIEHALYRDQYAALPETVARESGITWVERGGALRMTCSAADHPFLNRVVGLPSETEDLDPWLASLVEHYLDVGVSRWMVQVVPSGLRPGIASAFDAHGLVPLRGWAKHAGRVAEVRAPEAAARSDLRVERIGPDRAHEWASIVVPAFSYPEGSADWLAATVGRPGWNHYLALDGDEPAATAALFVSGTVGSLNFAATRPEFRRRGAQSVLIARRIEDARRLGLEWLVTETDEELPDLEFLEYLGSWDESDEEWLLFDEAEATAAQEEVERSDRAAEDTVPGKESTELENES